MNGKDWSYGEDAAIQAAIEGRTGESATAEETCACGLPIAECEAMGGGTDDLLKSLFRIPSQDEIEQAMSDMDTERRMAMVESLVVTTNALSELSLRLADLIDDTFQQG